MRIQESRRNLLSKVLQRLRSHPTSAAIGDEIARRTTVALNSNLSRRELGIAALGTTTVGTALILGARTIQERRLAQIAAGKEAARAAKSRQSPDSEQSNAEQQKLEQRREAVRRYILEGNADVTPRKDLQEAVEKDVRVVDMPFASTGVVTAEPENLPLVSRGYPLEGDQRSKLLFRFKHTMFPGTQVTWQREARIHMRMLDGTQVYERWVIRNPIPTKPEQDVPVDELMYTRVQKIIIDPRGEQTTIIDINDGYPTYYMPFIFPEVIPSIQKEEGK